MTEHIQSPPGPDASPDEIEADIAATRARLADSVDALADKMDVKARAQEKVDDVRSTAQAKVSDVRATAQAKIDEVTATAQAKAFVGKDKAEQGYREVRQRVLALPRPAQIALAAAPVLLVVLLVVRGARS
jgi:UDP-3-O-[3-hydroxymyristoyl] glucosamine N-acyltransferase